MCLLWLWFLRVRWVHSCCQSLCRLYRCPSLADILGFTKKSSEKVWGQLGVPKFYLLAWLAVWNSLFASGNYRLPGYTGFLIWVLKGTCPIVEVFLSLKCICTSSQPFVREANQIPIDREPRLWLSCEAQVLIFFPSVSVIMFILFKLVFALLTE